MEKISLRKPRVILCDDDQFICDLIGDQLKDMGYEVVTADTPVTCAFYSDHADSCPQHIRCADILIIDHNMPNMTGIELLELQHHKGCKLTSKNKLLITGRDDSELRKRAEALGCHFLPKPVDIHTILAWIKGCEERIDLSEPLAPDLFLPAKKKAFCVTTHGK